MEEGEMCSQVKPSQVKSSQVKSSRDTGRVRVRLIYPIDETRQEEKRKAKREENTLKMSVINHDKR